MAEAFGVDVGLLGDVRCPVSVTSCSPHQLRKKHHNADAKLELHDYQTSFLVYVDDRSRTERVCNKRFMFNHATLVGLHIGMRKSRTFVLLHQSTDPNSDLRGSGDTEGLLRW